MGRIFEALRRSSAVEDGHKAVPDFGRMADIVENGTSNQADFTAVRFLRLALGSEDRMVAADEQRTLGSEKIRILAARLRQLQDQRVIKKLLITSTVSGEGKTVLSTNLAISLAKMKQRVLLIDGDSHQASATRILTGGGLPGLTDWWRCEATIQSYIVGFDDLPLWLLPAGSTTGQHLEMLQSSRLAVQIDQLTDWFDWIVVDSPPSAPLADAAVWGQLADAILLVTREGTTPQRLLKKVLNSVDHSKLLGIILNDCSDRDQRYYMQYYNLAQR